MAFKNLMIFAMIFLVSVNAMSAAFVASGTANAWGIGTPVPEDEVGSVQDSREAFNVSEFGGSWVPGYDIVQATFGVLDTFRTGIVLLTIGGPTLLGNLLPDWIVTLLFAPVYLIIAAGVIEWWLGR